MVLSHLSLLLLLLLLSPLGCTSLMQNYSHGDNSSSQTPLSAEAAAGPILQNRPFVVVWNIPTAKCLNQFNIELDLGDFDIVRNPWQHFQGQRVTIFYRNRLGLYPYISHDGRKVNGGIPQLGDLPAHLSLTVSQLSALLKPNFSGLAVIDWEEWRPLWERNFGSKIVYRRLSKKLVRQERPDLTESDVKLLAKQRFEKSAQKFMEQTLQSGLRSHPRGFWGFYGFPACFNKKKRKRDKTYTGRCHGGTRRQNDRLSWLWTHSTALYPSIYLPQRLEGSPDAALMVRHRLLEALRVASHWRHGNQSHATPVLPYARLAFTHTLNFLNKVDLENTLGESASLGAAGVVLWGELKFAKSKEQCILLRDYVHNVLGPLVQSLRSVTQRCSIQLCHGNGRCARRQPNSGYMLTSVPDLNEIDLLTDGTSFRNHFMCQCYPGWTGHECQAVKTQRDD